MKTTTKGIPQCSNAPFQMVFESNIDIIKNMIQESVRVVNNNIKECEDYYLDNDLNYPMKK